MAEGKSNGKPITPLKGTFGTLKFKKSTEQMMREIDAECWDE